MYSVDAYKRLDGSQRPPKTPSVGEIICKMKRAREHLAKYGISTIDQDFVVLTIFHYSYACSSISSSLSVLMLPFKYIPPQVVVISNLRTETHKTEIFLHFPHVRHISIWFLARALVF